MKNIIYSLFVALAMGLIFSSCSEDEIFSKDVKVYVNTQFAPVNNPKAEILVSTTNVVLGESNFKFGFPVRITREISEDVQVSFAVDTSFVSDYNEKHESECLSLTPGSFKLTQSNNLSIKAGDLVSKDSVKIELSNLGGLKPGRHLLPVVMYQVESNDKGVQASKNLQVVYVEVIVQVTNIDPDNSTLIGEKVDRSNWLVSTPSGSNNVNKLIDEDGESAYYKGGGSLEFTVDMNETQAIKGFLLSPWHYGGNYAYNPTQVTFYSSEDGQKWSDPMLLEFDKPKKKEDIIKIKFFTPVKAQYFKFKLEGGTWGYNGLSDVNALK